MLNCRLLFPPRTGMDCRDYDAMVRLQRDVDEHVRLASWEAQDAERHFTPVIFEGPTAQGGWILWSENASGYGPAWNVR